MTAMAMPPRPSSAVVIDIRSNGKAGLDVATQQVLAFGGKTFGFHAMDE
jgi:hypothetical protein